jgi:exopolysaccharide production protein ExoZ
MARSGPVRGVAREIDEYQASIGTAGCCCGMTASPPDRLWSIQYLRAVAALMVLAYHVLGAPGVIGASGVDIFFVISGFVIGLITAGRTVDPLAFAWDRATRILPLYWLFTGLLVAVKITAPALLPRLPLDPGWIVSSFLLIPSAIPGTAENFPFLYQGWTLWYEALFYLLAVAAIVLSPRRQGLVLTVMLAGLVLAGLVLRPQGPVGVTYTDPLLLEFLAGYWFARWRDQGGRLTTGAGMALIAAGLGGLALAAVIAGAPEGWLRILWWGLPAMALVAGAVTIEDRGVLGRSRLLRLLGDASYAIYLSHGIAVSVLLLGWRSIGLPLTSPLDQPLLAIATFAVAAGIGVAVHLAIERPIMAWFRNARTRAIARA